MNYHWTRCPACSCELTIQFADRADGLAGSIRRWSSDRSVNDGRRLEIPRAEVSPDGSFQTACVCGEAISVASEAIEHATTERF